MSLFLANSGLVTPAIPAGGLNPSAMVDAFIAATGIANATIENALDVAMPDLYDAGILENCDFIYPAVGGDAAKHSYNLMDPALYQVGWNGTVTHNGNGFTGNGSTGYGNTGFDADTMTMNNTHLAVYSRTTGTVGAENMWEIGASSGGANVLSLGMNYFNSYTTRMYDGSGPSGGFVSSASSDRSGFLVASRRSSTDLELYRNGSSLATNTNTVSGALPVNRNLYLLARNDSGTAAAFSDRNIAWVSGGLSLTDTQVADYYTIVQAFQTALSRNV